MTGGPGEADVATAGPQAGSGRRWTIAFIVSAAVAISYLDRQTLPWALSSISRDIPISNEVKAALDSAFLVTYGLMYLGGGWLIDRLGTRRGFAVVMAFWSFACASHAFAADYGMTPIHGMSLGVLMLGASRLLLGMGEGGGFPAATRAITEWFAVGERSVAMGIINAGSAVGAVAAPPLIILVLTHMRWFGISPWRWVFLITGGFGLVWTLGWLLIYRRPESGCLSREDKRRLSGSTSAPDTEESGPPIRILAMLRHREVIAVVFAKFLSDAAWYFYLFWLPKFLLETFGLDLKEAGAKGWIPYAASGVGCLLGGSFSGWLLRRGATVNRARKIALGASAALMPWIMFVPRMHSEWPVIVIFSLAFFGHQAWSTIVLVLPTDLIPRRAVGTMAGIIGVGGALGGILLGQYVGYLRDHGSSFAPALFVTGSLHVLAFVGICVGIPQIRKLNFDS